MSLVTGLDQITSNLSSAKQQKLHEGEVTLMGTEGDYTVLSIVQASTETVWSVLTDYERFPQFLPSVVDSRILERRNNRVLVERKDRRKIGWLPIKVKIVTENIEKSGDRIDYRMVDGTLDEMHGSWQISLVEHPGNSDRTLLVQTITAKASMGPLQPYFYEVFESGLVETMADLRAEMQRQHSA